MLMPAAMSLSTLAVGGVDPKTLHKLNSASGSPV
jgi:hypothetical protein